MIQKEKGFMDKEIKKVTEKFLNNWKKKKWIKMVRYTQLTWRTLHKNNARWLESWFGLKNLNKWEIIKIEFVGDACRDIFVNIDYGKGIKKIRARVICETGSYKPDIEGNWGINPVSCLKEN